MTVPTKTAIDGKQAGAHVEVIDIRDNPQGTLVDQARELDIDITVGSVISGVHYASPQDQGTLKSGHSTQDGRQVNGPKTKTGRLIWSVSRGGWTPTVHLYCQAKGKLKFLEERHCFLLPIPMCRTN